MIDENKVIKSYALDNESIGILNNAAKDLGLKSRSEVLRYILKEFKKQCQKDKKLISEN